LGGGHSALLYQAITQPHPPFGTFSVSNVTSFDSTAGVASAGAAASDGPGPAAAVSVAGVSVAGVSVAGVSVAAVVASCSFSTSAAAATGSTGGSAAGSAGGAVGDSVVSAPSTVGVSAGVSTGAAGVSAFTSAVGGAASSALSESRFESRRMKGLLLSPPLAGTTTSFSSVSFRTAALGEDGVGTREDDELFLEGVACSAGKPDDELRSLTGCGGPHAPPDFAAGDSVPLDGVEATSAHERCLVGVPLLDSGAGSAAGFGAHFLPVPDGRFTSWSLEPSG